MPAPPPARAVPSPPPARPRRRRLPALLTALAIPVAAAAVPAANRPLLRAVGHALVAQDPLAPSDVIVVTADAGSAGVLEAADLVQAGVAPRVAVFEDPPGPVDQEFLRRGIPYEDAAARSVRQLRALGVSAIEVIPRAVAGSEDEGRVLPAWCDERGWHAVLVVSSADHTRRVRRVMRRAMAGHPARVSVRATRYSEFDPDAWWHGRDGVRVQLIETQKLLLDVARHPWP